jgi:hypothetical protein
MSALCQKQTLSLRRDARRAKSIASIDIVAVARQIASVGPDCSRPAYPRHIAQELQTRSRVGLRIWRYAESPQAFRPIAAPEPSFRQPPGELSRAAKRCLTPKKEMRNVLR